MTNKSVVTFLYVNKISVRLSGTRGTLHNLSHETKSHEIILYISGLTITTRDPLYSVDSDI